MPIKNVVQPDLIYINKNLRLKKYDGNFFQALLGYQDPYVYQNSEGIFDEGKKPDLDYIKGMFEWLDNNGELYFIEAFENNEFIAIGDVTIKEVNPPIAIWNKDKRGIGIGTLVMKTVIERLKELGVKKITGSTVYKWNIHSQRLHEKLGFKCIKEEKDEYVYELVL